MRLQRGATRSKSWSRIRTAAGVVQKGLRIEIVMKVQEIELLADHPDHPPSAAPRHRLSRGPFRIEGVR